MSDELTRARERRRQQAEQTSELKSIAMLIAEHTNNSFTFTERGFVLALYIAPPPGGCPHEGRMNIAHCQCVRHEFVGRDVEELMMKTLTGLGQLLDRPPLPTG